MKQELGSKNFKHQEGYIAVTSVIIISVLLITITTALSLTNYFSRFNILENEFKQKSTGLAEACLDYALGKLAADASYAGGLPPVNVGTGTCIVCDVAPTGLGYPKTIRTRAVYQKSYTNLSIVVGSNLKPTSWQEIPQITTAICP